MEINIVFNTTYIDVSSMKEINPELPENFEETIEKCYTIIKYINKEDLYKKLKIIIVDMQSHLLQDQKYFS